MVDGARFSRPRARVRRAGAYTLAALALTLSLPGAAQAQTVVQLVGNLDQTTSATIPRLNADYRQAFTTGDSAAGYRLTRVDLRMQRVGGTLPAYSMTIQSDSSGSPGTIVGTLTNPALPTSFGTVQFTSASGIDLAAGTTYHIVIDVSGNPTTDTAFRTTASTLENGAAGWSAADAALGRSWNSVGSWIVQAYVIQFAIYGYEASAPPEPPADPPAVPERLQVTPRPSGLHVSWRPPVTGERSLPVTGYNLNWREASAEDWTVVHLAAGDDYAIDSSVIRHTIDGLDNGTLYEVRVQALSDAGKGPWSPTASGTPVVPWLAPYWQGNGGFVVRPSDGRSAVVRIHCGGRRRTSREYAGDDGLIVRDIQRCLGKDGRPYPGDLIFEGIEDGGWYWLNGDRNVAVAPLVVKASLNGELRPPVPGGVTASPSGDSRFVREVTGRLYGTLMVHEGNGMMGIVPHLVDMEGDGAHVAPYWKGRGGIVGRPLDGESAEVRLSCGDGEAETFTLEPGEDGIIVTLLPRRCFDSDGAAIAGHLEADGFEDGVWYWINASVPFAAPLVARDRGEDELTVPLIPAGVEAEEGPLGTMFSRGNLTGVVPRLRTAPP
ncbi:MAG: fibronectin type III domain-containing protein [Acidobacteria bacterium]|nr:fibronectin type III domain-containing protein [Acidobacteriota bacterium]